MTPKCTQTSLQAGDTQVLPESYVVPAFIFGIFFAPPADEAFRPFFPEAFTSPDVECSYSLLLTPLISFFFFFFCF